MLRIKRTYFRITKALTVTLCMAMLTGCSALQLSYYFADTKIKEYIDDYLLIDGQDAEHVDALISAMMKWHRVKMLPKYAAFFETCAQDTSGGGLASMQISGSIFTFRTLVAETVEGAAPFISSILIGHTTPAKITHIEARFSDKAEKKQEFQKRPRNERLDILMTRRIKNFERFIGALDPNQKEIIRKYADLDVDGQARWFGYTLKRQAAFLNLLRHMPNETQISKFVVDVLNQGELILGPRYRIDAEKWWDRQIAMYIEVLQSLNVEQITELTSNLRSIAADLTKLAKQS